MQSLETDDFIALGSDFESQNKMAKLTIGSATVKLFSQRKLVDFAVNWMNENRH
tara:strand:+ start:548 stop:709 length:162 start_codon:yes stop_codon:yes gene_type:complete